MTHIPEIRKILRNGDDGFHIPFFNDSDFSVARDGGMTLKPTIVMLTPISLYVLKKKDYKIYFSTRLKHILSWEPTREKDVLIKFFPANLQPSQSSVEDAQSFTICSTTQGTKARSALLEALREGIQLLRTAAIATTTTTTDVFHSAGGGFSSRANGYRQQQSTSSIPNTNMGDDRVVNSEERASSSSSSPSTVPGLSANRRLVVKSMVDSDLSDCGALRTAYAKAQEAVVENEIKEYMKDTRKHMYALCVAEHDRFLTALESSNTALFSDNNGELAEVRDHSSRVSEVVTEVVTTQKRKQAEVAESQIVAKNISRAHSEVCDVVNVLQLVSSASSALAKNDYYSTVTILQSLLDCRRELALPHPVIALVKEVHIPQLREKMVTMLKSETNAWLTTLREKAPGVGASMMQQFGAKRGSAAYRVGREIVVDEAQNAWSVRDLDEAPEIVNTALMSEVLPISQGRLLQRIHALLSQQDVFGMYVRDNRRKQFVLEQAGMRAGEFIEEYDVWFHKLCGMIITDDVLASTFTPPLSTSVELHTLWEAICSHLMPLMTRYIDTYENVEKLKSLLDAGFKFLGTVSECVRSAQLNYTPLQSKLEEIRDRIIEALSRETKKEIGGLIEKLTFTSVSIKSEQEYKRYVSTHMLQYNTAFQCPTTFSLPEGESEMRGVPFTRLVPEVGACIRSFLSNVLRLCTHAPTPDGRIATLVTSMLSPIPDVLMRRAASLRVVHAIQLSMLIVESNYLAFLCNVLDAHISTFSTKPIMGQNRFHAVGPWLREAHCRFVAAQQELQDKLVELLISRVDELMSNIRTDTAWTKPVKDKDKHNYLGDVVLFLDTSFTRMESMFGGSTLLTTQVLPIVLRHALKQLTGITHRLGMGLVGGASNGGGLTPTRQSSQPQSPALSRIPILGGGAVAPQLTPLEEAKLTQGTLQRFETDALAVIGFAERHNVSTESLQQSLVCMYTHCAEVQRRDAESRAALEARKGASSPVPVTQQQQQTGGSGSGFGSLLRRLATPSSSRPTSPSRASPSAATPTTVSSREEVGTDKKMITTK
eukprot:PhM_4_TR15042/c0_g1_i1/m.103368/K19985/EXOC6, SEC15; exocyst complex component 6